MNERFVRVIVVLVLILGTVGCELLVEFDRDRIATDAGIDAEVDERDSGSSANPDSGARRDSGSGDEDAGADDAGAGVDSGGADAG